MKKKTELIVYIITLGLFVIFSVSEYSSNLSYPMALSFSAGVLMLISRYMVSPKIVDKRIAFSIVLFSITFSLCFIIAGYFFKRHLSEVYKIYTVSYAEKLLLNNTIPYLIIAAIIGFLNLLGGKNAVKKSYKTTGQDNTVCVAKK